MYGDQLHSHPYIVARRGRIFGTVSVLDVPVNRYKHTVKRIRNLSRRQLVPVESYYTVLPPSHLAQRNVNFFKYAQSSISLKLRFIRLQCITADKALQTGSDLVRTVCCSRPIEPEFGPGPMRLLKGL